MPFPRNGFSVPSRFLLAQVPQSAPERADDPVPLTAWANCRRARTSKQHGGAARPGPPANAIPAAPTGHFQLPLLNGAMTGAL